MPTFDAQKHLLIGESFMAADTVVRARIDVKTKARPVATLRAMGLTVSDAIRLLLVQVAADEKLPFLVKVPEPPRRRPMTKASSFPKGLSQ